MTEPSSVDIKKRKLVVAAPFYNEAECLGEFVKRVDLAALEVARRWPSITTTLLLIDDGSSDDSLGRVKELEAEGLAEVRVCRLSRNFGHSSALAAIIDSADGAALVLMDADLQDPPQKIPELVEQWLKGFDSVRVRRGKRSESLFFRAGAKVFYRLFNWFSGLQTDMGTFGLYSERVVSALREFPESARYYPGLVTLVGFKTAYIKIDRDARRAGESRVGYLKLLRLALLAMISFSSTPIHLVTLAGIGTSLVSAAAGVCVVLVRVFTTRAIPGWASYMSTQFFVGGILLFGIGIIGQYLAVIFDEVKRRPKYIVESVVTYKVEQSSKDPQNEQPASVHVLRRRT